MSNASKAPYFSSIWLFPCAILPCRRFINAFCASSFFCCRFFHAVPPAHVPAQAHGAHHPDLGQLLPCASFAASSSICKMAALQLPYCIFPLPHGNVLIILLYHAHRHFFHPMPFSLPQSGSPAVLMTAHVRQHPLTLLPHCHPPLTAAHEFLRTVRRRLPRLYMPDNACQDGFADGHILLPVHFCAVRRSVLPFPAPAFLLF